MKILFVFVSISFVTTGCSQRKTGTENTRAAVYKNIGGPCEGCEAIYETPVPFSSLNMVDTLPDFNEKGPKLEISGTVYKQDGKTPAGGVVLYIYHTNQQGRYPKKGGETGWRKRHGYIRGWVKTTAEGRYKFYTLKPGPYPGRNDPAHIHITVKEPDKSEYYMDDFVFDNDSLLTKDKRSVLQNRGGNGIMQLQPKNNLFIATRNIILGKNIPDYPTALSETEFVPGFSLLNLFQLITASAI